MLHPQARAAIAAAAGEPQVFDPGFDIGESRRAARAAAAAEPREAVSETLDLDADGVPVRLHRPQGAGDGVVVHLHGGSFVFHDNDVHDALARRLANRSGHAVLSVDYRRPPEHRFPAAPDDVSTVLSWLEREGDTHGLTGRSRRTATPPAPTWPSSPRCATPAGCGRSRCSTRSSTPRRGSTPTAPRPTASTRARRAGTGSSTPRDPRTSSTPTSPRCAATGSARCPPRW